MGRLKLINSGFDGFTGKKFQLCDASKCPKMPLKAFKVVNICSNVLDSLGNDGLTAAKHLVLRKDNSLFYLGYLVLLSVLFFSRLETKVKT